MPKRSKAKENPPQSLLEKVACTLCSRGELYPDGATRCSQAMCQYEPGNPRLWKKPAAGKGRLVKSKEAGAEVLQD